jgi:hypothetical protein
MTNLPDTLTDKQAMFNAAYIGLAGQGFERSWSAAYDVCAYRGDAGAKCAIGHCIPDSLYQDIFECGGATEVMTSFGIKNAHGLYDFAEHLQRVHDDNYEPDVMRVALQEFAQQHNLTIPTIDSQEAV